MPNNCFELVDLCLTGNVKIERHSARALCSSVSDAEVARVCKGQDGEV